MPSSPPRPARASNDVTHMTIWGNHSATQYPDLFNAQVGGKNAAELVDDQDWLETTFLPTVQQARRGDHRGPRGQLGGQRGQRDDRPHARLGAGHARGRLGVDGRAVRRLLRRARGPDLLIPVHDRRRRVQIVEGLEINDFSRGKIDASVAELVEERDAVRALGLID